MTSLLTLFYVDDESLSIRLDGQEIIYTNHDLDGWAGMERIRDSYVKVANLLGWTVTEVGDPNV